MNIQGRLYFVILIILIGMLLLIVLVQAQTTNPQTLFTDNTTATEPTTGITEMEQELLELISGATTSIDLAIYGFNRVSVREALIAAHNRGVTVRVVTDDDAQLEAEYAPHFKAIENAGITVVNDGSSSIMHNKFFIIDGETVWSGSTNITDNGFTFNHNNCLVFTSTLLADIYTQEFEEMFVSGLFGTNKPANVTHTIDYDGVPVEIYFSPSDNAIDEVLAEVNAATSDIRFATFFFTDDVLSQLMIEKAEAGVDIAGVWDKLGAGNIFSEDETLCNAGIPIKIEDFGGKLHNNFMVIDANGPSPRVITGSMNWTSSGDSYNDENTLIIHDAEVAQTYLSIYQDLYGLLETETLCFVTPTTSNPLPTPTAIVKAPATIYSPSETSYPYPSLAEAEILPNYPGAVVYEPTSTATPSIIKRLLEDPVDFIGIIIIPTLMFLVTVIGIFIAFLQYRQSKDSRSKPSILDTDQQVQLHKILDHYFSDQELRLLCMELGVDYEDLPFPGQSNKARELVAIMARNGRSDDLEMIIQQERPHLFREEYIENRGRLKDE